MAVAVKTKRAGRQPQATLSRGDALAHDDAGGNSSPDRCLETSIPPTSAMAAGSPAATIGELAPSQPVPPEPVPPDPALPGSILAGMGRSGFRPAHALLSTIGIPIDAPSLIFDGEWYRREYPDVAAAGLDPVRHYFDNGSHEGRNPNAYFDTNWYSRNNPDVAAAGLNPFLHYLLYGAREGRQPAP